MVINIADLEKVMNVLLAHLKQSNKQDININADYYWHIPEELLYNLNSEPKDHVVGQLSDDWAELQALGQGKKDPLAFDFVKLSAILRAIGEHEVI